MMVSRDWAYCVRYSLIPSIDLSVNVLKGKLWNEESEFDESKDKQSFRQYDNACERVKAFYREQHGEY